jgi:flagellar motor switch protein FliN/FliY
VSESIDSNEEENADNGQSMPAVDEANIELKSLSTEASADQGSLEIRLESLMNVPVTLSVEIGKCKIPIKQLVALNKGSLVELDKLVDEPLDLLVNGTLLARGEVVVLGDNFGLRLVDIVSQSERLNKLR